MRTSLPLLLLHGGRDHCRNWDWTAEALRDQLAHHRARPARARRQPVVAGRQLHHGRLPLRPGPAHPPAAPGARDHRRPLPRRQHRPPLCRHLSGVGGEAGGHRGARPAPACWPSCAGKTIDKRMDEWIREQRALGRLLPRRYAIDRGRLPAHAGGESAPLRRAGASPDRPGRQPERGRHLQLEVRQLRARVAAVRHVPAGTSASVVAHRLPDPPALRQGEQVGQPGRRWPRGAVPPREGAWASTGRGTGCTTTGWTSSSVSSASFSETRGKESDMSALNVEPMAGREAWQGNDMARSTDWIVPVSARAVDEIDAALRHLERRGLRWPDFGRDDFPSPPSPVTSRPCSTRSRTAGASCSCVDFPWSATRSSA